jgi:hypothetical protein
MLAGCSRWCNSSPVKSPRSKKQSTVPRRGTDQHAIDELYGLEPVFEPDPERESGSGRSDEPRGVSRDARFERVQCPYCGEPFETLLDLSGGSASYVEDCQVCCQPIDFRLEVDQDGRLVKLETLRAD